MRAFALVALALAGCSPGPTQSGFASSPSGQVTSAGNGHESSSSSSSSSTTTTTTTDASTSSTTSSSGAASPPDAGTPPDFGPEQPEGCKGKIDFLFVIARNGPMQQAPQRLLDSFDGFITAISEDFADFDSHIVVANPDGTWPGDACDTYMCPKYGHCGPYAEDYVCYSPEPIDLCERVQGAGILFNAGPHATNHLCELAGGRRYIVTNEEQNLAAQFECIASVGHYGPDTPMMKGIAAAVTPELNADGGCNEGFLRPDALLVIVMIMNSFDVKSYKSPETWAEAVLASKGHDPDAAVMVALINPLPEDPPKPDCGYDDGSPFINPLRIFAEQFPHRVISSVCADSYAPALAEAATVVKQVCGDFIPQ